jgi:predicted glycoside hydrolase/deacetylase ChbG (UPF0249 family)
MKVIVVNGYPMSGKDQFCNYCLDYMSKRGLKGGMISTIDIVKNIAKSLGWDGVKTPKDRKFLSDLKDLLTEWRNIPYRSVADEITQTYIHFHKQMGVPEDHIVFFIHCREPKEIEKFVEGFGAETVVIRRKDVEELEQSNHADSNILDYNYTYEIDNNKGLEELEKEAMNFINNLVKF